MPQYQRAPQTHTETRTAPAPDRDPGPSKRVRVDSVSTAQDESWADRHAKEQAARELRAHEEAKKQAAAIAARVGVLEREYRAYEKSSAPANAADRRFVLEAFITREAGVSSTDVNRAAIEQFAQDARAGLGTTESGLLDAVKGAVAALNLTALIPWRGKARALLQKTRLYTNRIPAVGFNLLMRMRLLCSRASSETARVAGLARQSCISVLKDGLENKTYLQISFGTDSFHFVELPEMLPDPPPPTKLLSSLDRALSKLVGDRIPIVWVDGDYEGVNFNQILKRGPQFRVRDPASVSASDNIANVLAAPALNTSNCRVLTGVPATAEQVRVTFKNEIGVDESEVSAGEWADEAQRWDATTGKLVETVTVSPASRDTVIDALRTSANVIVVVAHSDGVSIKFPNGSVLSKEDLEQNKDEISNNAPVVYLMCCKAGRISDVQSLAETLLEVGAKAVYAPMDHIGSPLKLFKRFVEYGSKQSAAAAFARAENKTGNREMVAWVR